MKKKIKNHDCQLSIDFDENILFSFLRDAGVDGWNSFIHRMDIQGHLEKVWTSEDKFPLSLLINFSAYQASFVDMKMSGLDLRQFVFSSCCFDNMDLTMVQFGVVEDCSFRNALLAGVELFSICGSDFTGATLKAISWSNVCYQKSNPPIGLPDEILEQCTIVPEEPPIVSGNLWKSTTESLSGSWSILGGHLS